MKNYFFLFFSFSSIIICAQREINCDLITSSINLDGLFEEEVWKNIDWETGFTQMRPFPGNNASQKTEIGMLHDKEALYIGIKCYDHPDSLSRVLSIRDDFNPNLDVAGVFIDTYSDKQNGFFFGITSRGVQLDAKIFNQDFNNLFNLVWNSKVSINDKGWFAELKIPYSALRFPKTKIQNWNINFARQISRFREESTWQPVNPDLENYLLESGKVKGIENITPPLRLAFIPFLSSYYSFSKNDDLVSTYNGGMDIKYGINEALTLDVTLLPDFGQVVFDKQVLNISPFEIQFNENRQFFTEGTELFTKSGIFYSRRIGVQTSPKVYQNQIQENEELVEIPSSVPLLNASKISGRLKNGLGIGVFNGITAGQQTQALNLTDSSERTITISPLSNYNVLVLDQNLKNNSFVTFTNTNVWRAGMFYDANVSAIKTKLNTPSNDYFIDFDLKVSSIINSEANFGHSWGFETGKQRGNFTFGINYYEESDTYDPNDLGFLRANNERSTSLEIGYRNFSPEILNLNKFFSNFSLSNERLYAPNLYGGTYWRGNLTMITNHFNAMGLRFNGTIGEVNDYFEPRVWGENFIRPVWTSSRAWISTNYQKPFAIDLGLRYTDVKRNDWWEWGYDTELRFRLSNQLNLIHEWNQNLQYNSEGYAVSFGTPADEFEGILFGNRDRLTTTQSLGIEYTATNRMGLTFQLRHYNAKIIYNDFAQLMSNGRLSYIDNYSGLDIDGNSAYDINYNAFTIDMLVRWVYLPGSELNFVWKNSIFTSDKMVFDDYWNTLNNTLQNGPINTLSLKIIYWLDYQYLKKKKIIE